MSLLSTRPIEFKGKFIFQSISFIICHFILVIIYYNYLTLIFGSPSNTNEWEKHMVDTTLGQIRNKSMDPFPTGSCSISGLQLRDTHTTHIPVMVNAGRLTGNIIQSDISDPLSSLPLHLRKYPASSFSSTNHTFSVHVFAFNSRWRKYVSPAISSCHKWDGEAMIVWWGKIKTRFINGHCLLLYC